MKRCTRAGLVALFLVAGGAGLFAVSDEIGHITYLEGTVQIIRNAKVISGDDVSFNTVVQNYDQVRVAKNGLAEISINKETGIDAVLTIQPGSTISLDITSLKSSQSGSVNLLSGSMGLKVQKLTNGNQLNVKTGTATMGVRGTKFDVSYSTSGDVLLTTAEGRVACDTDDGKTLYSAPGNVVQGSADGDWSSIPVAVDGIESFKRKWFSDRIAAFKSQPDRATRQFAALYLDEKTKFYDAYKELLGKVDTIQKWIREDQAGNIGALADRNRDKLALIAPLTKIRKVLVMFERTYFRLQELDDLYAQGIAASGQISQGMSVSDFFTLFRNDRADLEQKMRDVQYVTKLYAKRNDGSFPLDLASSPDMQSGDSFFATPSGF